VAKLVLGGRRGTDIVFQGNRQFLPAGIRQVINAYFNNWNTLRDIAQYPNLIGELGDARADRHFLGTDWERLHAHYQAELQRYTVVLHGERGADGSVRFIARAFKPPPPRGINELLKALTGQGGVLKDNFDIWRLEKLLARAKAKLQFTREFVPALAAFANRAVSFEESLSFMRQVQAYHSPEHLDPALHALLHGEIDELHTLRQPTALPQLAASLSKAGAKVRVHPTVGPVVQHYMALAKAAEPTDEDPAASAAGSAGGEKAASVKPASDPRVEAQLGGALKTRLYPFQREGVAFLVVNRRALLADDMGLGKTLQAIAGALCLKRRMGLSRVLIVCPASLKYQWQAEIHRFTRERCEVIGGDKDERQSIYAAAASRGSFISAEDRPFFYVVNYELVHRDLDALKALAPGLLVLDEAQRVKNFRAKTTQAVFTLPAQYAFVLTGTPLENQLMELYTIMRFIDERALGKNPLAFRDRYVILDRFGSITGYRLVEEVSRKIAALTMRRTREQALHELPDLVQNNVWLDLTDTQRQIYRELRGQARELLSAGAWDAAGTQNAFTLLQRLREVCDTPELIDPAYTESQKLAELRAILEEQVGALNCQVLVFTQWTRVGEILMRDLGAAGYEPEFLHGGVPTPKRQELVDRFQSGATRVLISTDAGGLGLNLQAASYVVNYDLPFNPAKLQQRIARAHRLGQKHTVFAVNLLCRATVEEKLWGILNEKLSLFEEVFGGISDPDEARVGVPVQRSLRELLSTLIG